MNATATVAVIGAISVPVVAIAGYLFNHATSKAERAAARDLANDAHEHDLEARRRERAYVDRREAYRAALEWAFNIHDQVLLTDPIIGQWKEPPEDLSYEKSEHMRVSLYAASTEEVQAAYETFRTGAIEFFVRNVEFQRIRAQDPPEWEPHQFSMDSGTAQRRRNDARREVLEAFNELVKEIKLGLRGADQASPPRLR